MVHRSGTARAIIEGRVLEILSAHIKGGLSIYQLADRLNKTTFTGAAAAWLNKFGFSAGEVRAVVVRLFNRGLVKHKPNGKRAGVWFLNGGVGVIPKPARNRWGEPRLFRFSEGGGPAWLR